jgi:hypothetical protein
MGVSSCSVVLKCNDHHNKKISGSLNIAVPLLQLFHSESPLMWSSHQQNLLQNDEMLNTKKTLVVGVSSALLLS